VQILFAGKAHPADRPGQDLIQHIFQLSQQPPFRGRVFFLENYDMRVARMLVQGVDVWLNTPRRPLEASGTSGMKASANGVLNLSILDGWWDEGYTSETGWAIGKGEEYQDEGYQDMVESQALYDLLENEIVPLFYQRDGARLPRRWISLMKSSLRNLCPVFNTSRMVREYHQEFYQTGAALHRYLSDEKMSRARSLAAAKRRITERWPLVRIKEVRHSQEGGNGLEVGSDLHVLAEVDLSGLDPSDVCVEAYHGLVDSKGAFLNGKKTRMSHVPSSGRGTSSRFESTISMERSGPYGYSVRVLPSHPDLAEPRSLGLIHWASG
jgi:starch phosphorylase